MLTYISGQFGVTLMNYGIRQIAAYVGIFNAVLLSVFIYATAPASGGHINPTITWTTIWCGLCPAARGTGKQRRADHQRQRLTRRRRRSAVSRIPDPRGRTRRRAAARLMGIRKGRLVSLSTRNSDRADKGAVDYTATFVFGAATWEG